MYQYRGGLFLEEALQFGYTFVECRVGTLRLYWHLDHNDFCVDAKFFNYGHTDYSEIGELLCSTYHGWDLAEIRDTPVARMELLYDGDNRSAYIDVCRAVKQAFADYQDQKEFQAKLRLARAKKEKAWVPTSAVDHDWVSTPVEVRLATIRGILERDILPYVNADQGNLLVVSLEMDVIVGLKFEGTCTSCPSALGSTLHKVSDVLRDKVLSGLSVRLVT